MSHLSMVRAAIQDTPLDLRAVTLACEMLGLEFKPNVKTFKWYGEWVGDYASTDAAYLNGIKPQDYGKCSHVIRLPDRPDAYEIGVVKMPDGTFSLCLDHWSGGPHIAELLARIGGKECGKLLAAVSQNKVVLQVAARPGHYVKHIDDVGLGKKRIVVGVRRGDDV